MEIWTAEQIGQSNGAYAGRDVEFEVLDIIVHGKLDRSTRSHEGPYVFLWVNGEMWTVPNATDIMLP